MDCNDIREFLGRRYDEIEAAAQAATPGPWRYNPDKHVHRLGTCEFEESVFAGPAGPTATSVALTGPSDDPQSMADARHIALHDPSHVLADLAAKRRILTGCGAVMDTDDRADQRVTLRHVLACLALPFADHPDYRQEWAV